MSEAFHQWSARRIAEAVKARRVSAVAVVDQILRRIDAVDPQIRSFATVDGPGARAAAMSLDASIAAGDEAGPLAGVPFSVKDLVATRGVETSFGSSAFVGNLPQHDAEAVARLRAAGAILIGKTTTPEFGHKALTSSPRYGHTRNPWALDRSPGGSSGGSAAAVAAGLGPISLTTDGSGSARIPAGACGVLGLKPTQGLIPNENAVELFSNFITLGLATRTVDDLALALSAVAGAHPADPWSRLVERRTHVVDADPRTCLHGLRFRFIETMGNQRLAAVVRARLDTLFAVLAEQGAVRVDEAVHVGGENRSAARMDWGGRTMFAMMRGYQRYRLEGLVARHGAMLDPTLVAAVREGAQQSAIDTQRAPADRSELYKRVETLFDTADVLITPTLSAPPPRVDHRVDEPFSIDGEEVGMLRQEWYCYTGAFNLTGHPAISVPIGFDDDGIPVGVQIVGPWFDEARLLNLAGAIEQLMPWAERWPALDAGGTGNTVGATEPGGYLPYPAT